MGFMEVRQLLSYSDLLRHALVSDFVPTSVVMLMCNGNNRFALVRLRRLLALLPIFRAALISGFSSLFQIDAFNRPRASCILGYILIKQLGAQQLATQ